jgi:hypothetical protein
MALPPSPFSTDKVLLAVEETLEAVMTAVAEVT